MSALVDGTTELPDQYVASFGKDAAVGCFAVSSSASGQGISFARHDRVLLKTPRGLEVGSILGPASIRQARLLGADVRGDLVRSLSAEDDSVLERMSSLALEVLSTGERLLKESDMPLSLIDAEIFFDLRHALLHILHPNPDVLADFVQTICDRTGLVVRLANLALPAEVEEHGCGKPDCGSGEGGCSSCSTGGCSTGCGTGAAPPDLRPYFAHLRDQMETNHRVPLV